MSEKPVAQFTPGAMRAAKKMVYGIRGWQQRSPAFCIRQSENWAEIITRETGDRELLEALEAAPSTSDLDKWFYEYQQWEGRAEAVIRKARGER